MIYIHIPFCRQICNYCDFHHSASLTKRDEMVAAIISELHRRKDYVSNVSTLYFGGGTPSVCSIEQIGLLINTVRELWNVDTFEEMTLESNPEDLTVEYLKKLRNIGINRLSIGVQSFFDEHLREMNRSHSAQQAIQAVRNAQSVGFDNITIDLMYGLPWLTEEQWQKNIDTAISLDVPHISAYHLTIEPRTILGKRKIEPVSDEISELHFQMLQKSLMDAGFEHYEVSNFAKYGRRAIHNSRYWHGNHYLGVGPAAHSFNGATRHWNVSSNKLYLEGDSGGSEVLTRTDRQNEYVMTRLRTSDGFSIAEFETEFATQLTPVPGLMIENGRARISPSDFLISDSIISSLFKT